MSDGSASTAGRTQLLAWLNALCQTRLERVEQLRSGAVACQVLDALFPGRVPMSRVDWAAASERHFVANFMLLQRALAAVGERRPLPVDRLVRGSYLDNLELLQWLNDLCVRRGGGGPRHYDAAAWREKGRGGAEFNRLFGAGGAAPAPAVKPRKTPTPRRTGRLCSGDDAVAVDYAAMLERKMQGLKIQSDAAEQEQEQLAAQMKELQQQLEATAAERDFYVKKLAAIEELVHNVELAKTNNAQTNMLGLAILDVLYATVEDDEEFVPF
ncbi:Microtubule -associated protein EB1 [Phytophthora cinnamomi]|uniref:Microtubule -associated protein EB1 n=1 Tax=Phytophthora cinnamomi TaxID=4785 RepID=UPI003559613A|nr:Microtubule -associated protein EB1 [Phytophthora cinnamomi]